MAQLQTKLILVKLILLSTYKKPCVVHFSDVDCGDPGIQEGSTQQKNDTQLGSKVSDQFQTTW